MTGVLEDLARMQVGLPITVAVAHALERGVAVKFVGIIAGFGAALIDLGRVRDASTQDALIAAGFEGFDVGCSGEHWMWTDELGPQWNCRCGALAMVHAPHRGSERVRGPHFCRSCWRLA